MGEKPNLEICTLVICLFKSFKLFFFLSTIEYKGYMMFVPMNVKVFYYLRCQDYHMFKIYIFIENLKQKTFKTMSLKTNTRQVTYQLQHMVIICKCREFEICYEYNNPYTQDLSQFRIYYLLNITNFLDIVRVNGNVLQNIHLSFTEKRN